MVGRHSAQRTKAGGAAKLNTTAVMPMCPETGSNKGFKGLSEMKK
jgi:hypothetical protein